MLEAWYDHTQLLKKVSFLAADAYKRDLRKKVRGWRAYVRDMENVRNESATQIQALYRGNVGRAAASYKKRSEWAVDLLTRWWRSKLDVIYAQRLKAKLSQNELKVRMSSPMSPCMRHALSSHPPLTPPTHRDPPPSFRWP